MEINIDERVALAQKNFASGYNCSQSVVLAYADVLGADPKLLATISAPFGGGLGRLREVCGAVSGMSIVAGFIKPSFDPKDQVAKGENYLVVKSLAEQFRAENGSIICRELLGIDEAKRPEVRKRPCAELVAMAARFAGEAIQNHTKAPCATEL